MASIKLKCSRSKATCKGYPQVLTSNLDDLRKENTLCDVTINIGGQSFHAHRAVLAAASSYFMGMFTRGFQESHQSEINIDGNAEVFQSLLQFSYTGEMDITDETAFDIITTANYMQFTQARDTAISYVRKSVRVSPEDAFKISLLDYIDKKLVKRLQFYLMRGMKKLQESEIFLQEADLPFMEDLLERKDVIEADETEVLQTVACWLKYDWENRNRHATALLQKIHLGDVNEEILTEVADVKILEIPECKRMFEEVIQSLASASETPETELASSRNTITAPITLGSSSECRFFNINNTTEGGSWQDIPHFCRLPKGSYFAYVIKGNKTLYAKARDHRGENCLYRYRSVDNQWEKLCAIDTIQNIHLAYLNGFIYSIDGKGDVQRYSIDTNKWETVQRLPITLYYDIIISTFMGKLLVYGNLSPNETHAIYILLVYDPELNTWTGAMTDKFPRGFNDHVKVRPVIMQHNGSCYRVMFKRSGNQLYDPFMAGAGLPVVHELKFQMENGVISVEIGDEESQDLIPESLCGAFRIEDEVFVSSGGIALNTGLKAWEDVWGDQVDLHSWKRFGDFSGICVAHFTFSSRLADMEYI